MILKSKKAKVCLAKAEEQKRNKRKKKQNKTIAN